MNFIFYYIKYPEIPNLIATIKSDFLEDVKVNMIISYLTDDGGSSLDSHINFLQNNILKLKNVSEYEFDISSNSYGADVFDDQVRIYFFYDESQECKVNRLDFLHIMSLWVSFLKKEPIEFYKEQYYL